VSLGGEPEELIQLGVHLRQRFEELAVASVVEERAQGLLPGGDWSLDLVGGRGVSRHGFGSIE
jgi:hypothetical protein